MAWSGSPPAYGHPPGWPARPAGSAGGGGAVHAAVACGTAAVTAAAVVAVAAGASSAPARTTVGGVQARTTAYVVRRVENALAGEHLVFRGRTVSGPPSISWISWAYGPRNRLEEFSGNGCGHVLPNASCTHRGRSQAVLDQGTALIGGKLTGVYVTYYNRKWSLSPGSLPASACSRTGALEMGGPVLGNNWPAFIHATLACGAATVTGHVRIDGVEATKITGSPVTVRLHANYAKIIREKWLRERWTLYVNPKTYLPVRLSSSSFSFGGPAR